MGNQSVLIGKDYRIMLVPQLLATSSNANLNPFQNTVRLWVFLCCVNRIWTFFRDRCKVKLLRMLRGSLGMPRASPELSPRSSLWIFSICSYAGHGTESFTWAARGLGECAERLYIFQWTTAASVLGQFLVCWWKR